MSRTVGALAGAQGYVLRARQVMRGVDSTVEVFYTGRVNDHANSSSWVSVHRADGFEYQTHEAAARKAAQFNAMTPGHGLTFEVLP